jgi:hypothetical protein
MSRFGIETEFIICILRGKQQFERPKTAANSRFEQASCGIVLEPSSNIFMVKICQDWFILPENIASLPNSSSAKISTFHQTALNNSNTMGLLSRLLITQPVS